MFILNVVFAVICYCDILLFVMICYYCYDMLLLLCYVVIANLLRYVVNVVIFF